MLAALKQRMEEKKARAKAIAESRQWRTNPLLQDCLQAMRGSCTVAPMELHEAVIAVVNIALREDIWTQTDQIPEDFLSGSVYIVWDDEKLPVLKAPWTIVEENIPAIRTSTNNVFLVSEIFDQVVYYHMSKILLYSLR